jgi:hypothetical protein
MRKLRLFKILSRGEGEKVPFPQGFVGPAVLVEGVGENPWMLLGKRSDHGEKPYP